jgi:Ca2+-binding EF-hand superfamily protein
MNHHKIRIKYFLKVFVIWIKTSKIIFIFIILFNYRKSYLDIEDLKRCNQLLNQHFSEDELEGLLELAGKSDGKITFENFTEFLNNDN